MLNIASVIINNFFLITFLPVVSYGADDGGDDVL